MGGASPSHTRACTLVPSPASLRPAAEHDHFLLCEVERQLRAQMVVLLHEDDEHPARHRDGHQRNTAEVRVGVLLRENDEHPARRQDGHQRNTAEGLQEPLPDRKLRGAWRRLSARARAQTGQRTKLRGLT